MKTVLAFIHDTYAQRCGNPAWQKDIWHKSLASAFPPDLDAYPEERPSVLLAAEAGDLGCALLWIVQAALIHPIMALIAQQAGLSSDQQNLLSLITPKECGAMAHSEPREKPLIMTPCNNGIQLEGVKKYITAGRHADFILATARAPEEEKISRLLLLPRDYIAEAEMETLDLKGLYTIGHARLTLKDKMFPLHCLLPLSPGLIRKALKVNGLVERSLIMEAMLALMIYLNKQMSHPPADKKTLKDLLAQQSEYTNATIGQARTGENVQWRLADLNAVNTAIEKICNAADDLDLMKNMDLFERVNDLRFFRSLWS